MGHDDGSFQRGNSSGNRLPTAPNILKKTVIKKKGPPKSLRDKLKDKIRHEIDNEKRIEDFKPNHYNYMTNPANKPPFRPPERRDNDDFINPMYNNPDRFHYNEPSNFVDRKLN